MKKAISHKALVHKEHAITCQTHNELMRDFLGLHLIMMLLCPSKYVEC